MILAIAGMVAQASGTSRRALPCHGGHAWNFAMTASGKTSSGKATSGKPGKADQRAARQARLAAALRENLKRRKQQARQRSVADQTPPGGASSQDDEVNTEVAGTAGQGPDFRRNRNDE
jgi:hypothetical protein